MTGAPIDAGVIELAGHVFALARGGCTEELAAYVDAGVPANLTNDKCDTLLILAAYHRHPGTVAALSLDGYHEDYLSLAGPTWRNEIDADVVLSLGTYRPARHASSVACPVLVQIADFDRSAPPHAAVHDPVRPSA